MKKFLLSLVAILATMTLNAKEEVTGAAIIEFAKAWEWQNVKGFSTGELIEDKEKKTVDDTNLVYADKSAFDYLVIEYNESTTEVKFLIQFNTNHVLGQWGAEFYQGETIISKSAKAGFAAIKLDPDHKNTVNTVALQNTTAAGKIDVKTVYFATQEEYNAVVAEYTVTYDEGKTLTMDGGNIMASEFNGYSLDAKVEFSWTATGKVSSYMGWGAGAISGLNGDDKKEPYVKAANCNIANEGENKTILYLSDLVEALNTPCEWPGTTAYGLYWNMWGFDGCACAIKDVKIYEKVGSTAEKFVAKDSESEGAKSIYVIGNINGSTSWQTNVAAAELAYDNATSTYTGSITVDSNYEGNGWFTIIENLTETEGDWDTFNANRLSVSKDWGTLNEAGTLAKNGDVSFKLPAGTYTVTVDLEKMTILIAADATSIQSVSTSVKSGKYIENNAIVIYKNGKKYNVAGVAIK